VLYPKDNAGRAPAPEEQEMGVGFCMAGPTFLLRNLIVSNHLVKMKTANF
jgi:hypothetical protein